MFCNKFVFFFTKGLMKKIKKDIEKKKRAQQHKGALFEGGLHFCIMYKERQMAF